MSVTLVFWGGGCREDIAPSPRIFNYWIGSTVLPATWEIHWRNSLWRIFLSRSKTAVKPSFGLTSVVYLGHVNSGGVAVGTERTQAIHYLTPALNFIGSVLKVIFFFRRSCQVLQTQLHPVLALTCKKTRETNRKSIRESLGTFTRRSIVPVKSYFRLPQY